jgi:hypothetical protein
MLSGDTGYSEEKYNAVHLDITSNVERSYLSIKDIEWDSVDYSSILFKDGLDGNLQNLTLKQISDLNYATASGLLSLNNNLTPEQSIKSEEAFNALTKISIGHKIDEHGNVYESKAIDPTNIQKYEEVMKTHNASSAPESEAIQDNPSESFGDAETVNYIPGNTQSTNEEHQFGKSINFTQRETYADAKDLFEECAMLSTFNFQMGSVFNDGINRKIDCFVVDKTEIMHENTIHFEYGRSIKSISITQTLTDYGISGVVELEDINNFISLILENASNFYFVISIFETYEEESGTILTHHGHAIEPYIFEIDNVICISEDSSAIKTYKIILSDIISSTLKKTPYGNLLLHEAGFANYSNCRDIFACFIDFAARIIYYTHKKRYKIDPKIKKYDNYNNDEFSDLLRKVLLADLSVEVSCYEVLNQIYRRAAVRIMPPEDFPGQPTGQGIFIPLFLLNEIPDISLMYYNHLPSSRTKADKSQFAPENLSIENIKFLTSAEAASAKNTNNNTIIDTFSTKAEKVVTCNGLYIKRGFYFRDILMPFELAFRGKGSDKNMYEPSFIYENINPLTDINYKPTEREGKMFRSANGYVISPLIKTINLPGEQEVVGRKLKNLILLSGGSAECVDNMLIYFNWIYEFYKYTFLKTHDSNIKSCLNTIIAPSVDPQFHIMEGEDQTAEEEKFLATLNADVVVAKTNDVMAEAHYHVGRILKSLIMSNSLFGFSIKGNLFRHPCEIIKINSPNKSKEDENEAGSLDTFDSGEHGFSLGFITSVTHSFVGNTFNDIVYANKICTLNGIERPGGRKFVSDMASTNDNNTSLVDAANNEMEISEGDGTEEEAVPMSKVNAK